jgi:hypothetical protein
VAVLSPATIQLHGQRSVAVPQLRSFDPMEKSIEELQRAMQAGEVTSRQLVEIYPPGSPRTTNRVQRSTPYRP